jgi:hypothetical protein
MSAYIISEVDVRDAMGFEAYRTIAAKAIAHYGGRYLVRSGVELKKRCPGGTAFLFGTILRWQRLRSPTPLPISPRSMVEISHENRPFGQNGAGDGLDLRHRACHR